MVASERWIDFAMLVQIRSDGPGAVLAVEEENHALADVDKHTDLAAASTVVSILCPEDD